MIAMYVLVVIQDVADSDKDCAGVCFGNGALDECGLCNGGNYCDDTRSQSNEKPEWWSTTNDLDNTNNAGVGNLSKDKGDNSTQAEVH